MAVGAAFIDMDALIVPVAMDDDVAAACWNAADIAGDFEEPSAAGESGIAIPDIEAPSEPASVMLRLPFLPPQPPS